MPGRHSRFRIQMTDQIRATLQSWLHHRKTPHGQARRARALLLLEQGQTFVQTAEQVGLNECHVRKWAKRFLDQGVAGLYEKPRPGRSPHFRPEVALHVVKLACERPDHVGRSLSQWNCPDLARQLVADGIVQSISAETIRTILQSHRAWNRGNIISGCLLKCLVMNSLPSRFKKSLISLPARSQAGRWYCVLMRRRIFNLVRDLLRLCPLALVPRHA